MAEFRLPSASVGYTSPRLAGACLSDVSTCSSMSGIGDDICGTQKDAHASHSQEVVALRTFACLQAASTKKLEKRVADLETQLREQADERQGAILSQALLMKKITRLEVRCSELESPANLGRSPCEEQTTSSEPCLEHVQNQLDAALNGLQPMEFEYRLEGLSMAGEKALEEIRRTAMELIAAASRFAQQVSLVGSSQGHDAVERPTSVCEPQEVLRTTSLDLSRNLPTGATPAVNPTSSAPLPHLLEKPCATQAIQGPSKLQEHKHRFSVKTRTRGASAAPTTAASIGH